MTTKRGITGLALVLSVLLALTGCSDSDDSSDGGLLAPAGDVSGTWSVEAPAAIPVPESSSSPGWPVCRFELPPQSYELEIVQDGNGLVVLASIGDDTREFSGVISGSSLAWTGSYPQDGGTMTETFEGSYSADPNDPADIPIMFGTSILFWTDDPENTCQAMIKDIQGFLN